MQIIPNRIRDLEQDSIEKMRDIALPSAAWLIAVTVTILLFGLTMLYSTSYGVSGSSFFSKQLMWGGIGLVSLTIVLFLGYKRVSNWSAFMMIGIMLLLLIADFCFPAVKGAHRWIKIPGIGNIQPSEYAKVVISLFLAKFLSDHSRLIQTHPYKGVMFPCAIWCAAVIGLVLLGKDLGTSLLLICIVLGAMLVVGLPMLRYIPLFAAVGVAGFFYIKYFDPMRWARLTIFLNPEPYSAKTGYQLWHSLLALGSGGWFGLGFTQSRMKQDYLPEAHTDFILAIVGEELGLISIIVVIIFYLIFLFLALRIASVARTRQGMILAFCCGIFIGIQSLINVGVISGAFPTKGMPAPFISYGGSNLVTCITAVGLILSVAFDAAQPDYQVLWKNAIKEKFVNLKKNIRKSLLGD